MSFDHKRLFRKESIARRAALTSLERQVAAESMQAYILSLPAFIQAESVLVYAAFGEELATADFIESALAKGKKVYLPKVVSVEESAMEFYQIRSLGDLKPGYRGILEPEAGECFSADHGQIDNILMIVPGVAFTSSGNRLGYGKGFYDNYLRKYPDLQRCTIGVGYACQLYEQLPVDERDIRLQQVHLF